MHWYQAMRETVAGAFETGSRSLKGRSSRCQSRGTATSSQEGNRGAWRLWYAVMVMTCHDYMVMISNEQTWLVLISYIIILISNTIESSWITYIIHLYCSSTIINPYSPYIPWSLKIIVSFLVLLSILRQEMQRFLSEANKLALEQSEKQHLGCRIWEV